MGTKKYILGIDIGTQGTKTSLVCADGELITEVFKPSNLIYGPKGIIEQLPDEIYGSVVDGIREAIDKAGIYGGDVLVIGLDGQMAGIMGIDRDWNAVTNYDSWLDTRCEKYMPMIKEWGEEEFISITGCPVTYAHGPKILWWKHERRDIYNNIDKFVTLTTYIAGRLCGLSSQDAYIDYTHLHFSGFADVYRKEWSTVLLKDLAISKDKLPRIINPWDIIGHLTQEAAQVCSLVPGIPIVGGCGDTAAATLGAGITEKGKVFDIAGTASVFSCCVDTYKPDTHSKTLIYMHSVLPNLWTPLAYISGGGQCLAWFKEQLTDQEGSISFKELDQEAALEEPGSGGLFFIPHFAGRVCPNNPYMRGSWLGLNWSHKRGSMYRSIMEAIAYEYKYYLDIIKALTDMVEFNEVIAVGGGAKSAIFNSIKSDVLNIPYSTLKNSDTAAMADAVIAGYGIGLYDDIKITIDGYIKRLERIQPDQQNHEKYSKPADIYRKIIKQVTETYQLILH